MHTTIGSYSYYDFISSRHEEDRKVAEIKARLYVPEYVPAGDSFRGCGGA